MHRRALIRNLALAALASIASPALAYILPPNDPDPWLSTASGSRVGDGQPATITWSIIPDGTLIEKTATSTVTSNFISFMNSNFGGNSGQSNLTLQPWFHLLSESFNRWNELSGVNFVYEPKDDKVLHPSANGVLGVRGDIRIGGMNIDGAKGTLAFTYLPPDGGDIAVDTGDGAFFKTSTNNFVGYRNTLMHEIGHAVGFDHVESTSALLMEPFINTSFDGPQLDEVRGIQSFFGDANEKANGGQGNNAAGFATPLGTIASGGSKIVGAAANVTGQAIAATATDFVSIARASDYDFYSFSVSQPSLVSATLTPRGGVFTQASEDRTPTSFNANNRNDLDLYVVDFDGASVLGAADQAAAGVVESISNVYLPGPGTYYARVGGSNDDVQLYQLSLAVAALNPADFDHNGTVDGDDLVAWSTDFATEPLAPSDQGDANGDGIVDGADLLIWQQRLGAGSIVAAGNAVPEPTTIASGTLALVAIVKVRRRRSPA